MAASPTRVNRRAIVLGGAASLASRGARAAAGDDLLAAARREGAVVIYSAYVSPATNEPIARAFEKAFGLRVETFMARGPELRERIRVERLTHRLLGDLQHNAITTTSIGIATDGNVEPHGDMPNVARLKPDFASRVTDLLVPIFTINYGVLVNTALVPPEREPKSWHDLLDPAWKGRILLDDPRATGGGRVMFHQTMDRFGRSFQDALAAQQPTLSRDYGEATRRLARGEFALYAPLIFSQLTPLKGLPVKAIIPTEGVTYGSYCVSILNGAMHPNAARLVANHYLSDEIQAIYGNSGHGIVVRDLAASLLPDMRPFAEAPPLVAEDFTRVEPYLALAKQIYG